METKSKNRSGWIKSISVIISILLSFPVFPPTYAAMDSFGQNVTMTVPMFSQITGDIESFTLHFDDITPGSETDTQMVTYRVKANDLNKDKGVVQAHLNASYPNIEVKADVGTYAKMGGNAVLVESAEGYVTLGETWTSLCDKQTLEGSGRVAVGTFGINYKAVATGYLEKKDIGVSIVITLVDT